MQSVSAADGADHDATERGYVQLTAGDGRWAAVGGDGEAGAMACGRAGRTGTIGATEGGDDGSNGLRFEGVASNLTLMSVLGKFPKRLETLAPRANAIYSEFFHSFINRFFVTLIRAIEDSILSSVQLIS